VAVAVGSVSKSSS